jgi:hypothetical protein
MDSVGTRTRQIEGFEGFVSKVVLELPTSKVELFLMRVAHDLTVAARDPDPPIDVIRHLQGCNEVMHRITSYLMHRIRGDEHTWSNEELVSILLDLSNVWTVHAAFVGAWRRAEKLHEKR